MKKYVKKIKLESEFVLYNCKSALTQKSKIKQNLDMPQLQNTSTFK